MLEFYELYGSREASLFQVANLVSGALGLAAEPHESYYLNEYLLAKGPAGQKITIESNQLEDEDGKYLQEPQFPEYRTLVRLEYEMPAQEGEQPCPDTLSNALGSLPGLTLLERHAGPVGH